MRVVDDPGALAVGNELARDCDDVPRMQRHARCKIDVVDDVDPQTRFGDDRERLMKRMRVATHEVTRFSRNCSGHDDVADEPIRSRARYVCIRKAIEERAWRNRDHIAGAIARAKADV